MEKEDFQGSFALIKETGIIPVIYIAKDGYFYADSYKFINEDKWVVFKLKGEVVGIIDLKLIKAVKGEE